MNFNKRIHLLALAMVLLRIRGIQDLHWFNLEYNVKKNAGPMLSLAIHPAAQPSAGGNF